MRRIEHWTPDTCRCKITDAWEYIEGATPVHLGYGGSVLRKCEVHKDIPDDELYEVLLGSLDGGIIGENRLKNYTEGYLLGKAGVDFGFHEPKKNKDGSDAGIGWKDGLKYKWSFQGTGKNRKLHIDVEGADLTPHKKKIKEACDGRFGKDRVMFID